MPARRSPSSGRRASNRSIPLNFSGPKWTELTGINVNVIEVPPAEMFTKILQEHRAGTGAYDALNVIPAWMPDLARAGALEPLDAFVDQYGFRDELQTHRPGLSRQPDEGGRHHLRLPDDGDVFVFYYRTDVLGDPAIQAAFEAAKGYDLPVPPTTWDEYLDVACFITEPPAAPLRRRLVPRARLHPVPLPGALPHQWRPFFDPETMRARSTRGRPRGLRGHAGGEQVHAARRRDLGLRRESRGLPRRRYGDDRLLAALWPLGRRLRPRGGGLLLGAAQPDRRQGRLCADPGRPPAARRRLLARRLVQLAQQGAAYLFIQWLNSEDISIERVQLPYALRDPFRDSHFVSEEYKSRWPEAPQYLAALQEAR
jgi:multiple sugar transport system substrate-binding protein